MNALNDLMAYQRETEALAQISGRLAWDQETMMPRGAAEQRGEEIGAIEGVLHARRTDPRVGGWLDKARPDTAADKRSVALIERAYRRNACIPARLATEMARVTSVAQGIWADARATNDLAHFLPTLDHVVRLKREAGAALAAGGFGRDAYDALLDDYEPGATAASIATMFDRMRPRLVALREAILGANEQPARLDGSFGAAAQMALAREMADSFGYDWTRGRLDIAVHPFSSGSGNDVRITTRVTESDPFDCIYATIHEVGHACYELGVAKHYRLTPLGQGVSMGVHESQSRICENQLGRSRAFAGWLYNRMIAHFGDFGVAGADTFYATLNRVQPGFIRTEADEVHYNLHIMMRFDLERALIDGSLPVAGLEEAWNHRFAHDFGQSVDRPSNGVLQDVHWSAGLFGYFPTYALGNVYAGNLMLALRRNVPDLDSHLAQGDARMAMDWLRDSVQVHGGLFPPEEVISRACGFQPTEGPLLDYLEGKFRGIYGL